MITDLNGIWNYRGIEVVLEIQIEIHAIDTSKVKNVQIDNQVRISGSASLCVAAPCMMLLARSCFRYTLRELMLQDAF